MRVSTKIGDVFSVKIDGKQKKYFQLVAYDLTQLNSDVIRVFKTVYPLDSSLSLEEIVNGEVEFYVHCVTKWGVKLGFWEKEGKVLNVGETNHIIFRDTSDYGTKKGEEPIKISNKWYVWKIGDKDFTRVNKLVGENRKAEIGLVMNPESVVNRIKTGEYGGVYPGFE